MLKPLLQLLSFINILIMLLLNDNMALAAKMTALSNLDAPDEIAFFDDEGNRHFLSEFEDKTVLLIFWATWCASCSHELPSLDVLQKDFRKLPFVVLAVSQDFQGVDVVKAYFKRYDIKHLKIYHDYQNQLFKSCAVVGLPTSILINQNGKMVLSFTGAIDWYSDDIRGTILSYIPGDYPEPKNSRAPLTLNQLARPVSPKQHNNNSQDSASTNLRE